jgi:hypothetical protein
MALPIFTRLGRPKGIRLAQLDKPRVLSVLQRLLPVLEHESPAGKLWIVDETSVRARG